MVAIDLVGPFAEALDGSTYAIVIHNVFSRMTSVAGLKSKADAPTESIKWVKTFKARTKYSVLGVRSENAGELTSKKFNQFLASKNIHHGMSVLYKHHQNGAVERTNRSLLDMARTSLLHAKLPQSLRMLALKHTAFVFNRVVHSGSSKTPYKLCLEKIPSLDMLQVFGCRAYLHDANYKKQFVQRETPLIHVGVSEESHGWLLWETVTKNIQRGASVIFHEDDFPSEASDVKSVEAIISSIQVKGLGDFSQLREFGVQDACISSISAVSSFMSDAPDT
jgi:hypothetical protein